ncbi:hypothetical protein MPSEU_000922900 [Mayamaea pseudoterrestris]|nr:hypothetical protein MPSEU_000922900 [Mayamaea pseudoterrestris]
MNRSLAILARKHKEAQGNDLNFQCMDDGGESVVSFDISLAQSRRNLMAQINQEQEQDEETAVMAMASAHAVPNRSISSSMFQRGVASLARKVSSRMSNFRDKESTNERNELVSAANAVAGTSSNSNNVNQQDEHDQNNQQLAHHLHHGEQTHRRRASAAGGLSPPSIISDEVTIDDEHGHNLNDDAAAAKQRRSQSVPSTIAKRRGRRSRSVTTTTRVRRTDVDSSDRRFSSGSKTSSSGAESDSKTQQQQRSSSKLVRRSHHGRVRESNSSASDHEFSASMSDLERRRKVIQHADDVEDDDEDDEAEPKKKTRRRVIVKVRSTRVDPEHPATEGNQDNEELIRDALKHRSRKIDQLLHAKLSSSSGRPRRRGSNGAQSCVELQSTSRESLLVAAKSPAAASKSPLRVKMSPGRNLESPTTLPSVKVSRICVEKPERSSSSNLQHEDIDAPVGILHHRSSHHSPANDSLRRSRSKCRSDKDAARSSSAPKDKEMRVGSRHKLAQSPTISPARSESSRSRKGDSPKDVHSRREHRKRSTKLEEIKNIVLDVEDDIDGDLASPKPRDGTRRKHGLVATPPSQKTIVRGMTRSTHSPKSMSAKRSEHSPKTTSIPSRSKHTSATIHKSPDGGLVEDLKKEMSEANQKSREQLMKSKHEKSSHTPKSRPRKALNLEDSYPASKNGKELTDEVSLAESVGTATGTPKLLRRKRVSARSPASDRVVRSASKSKGSPSEKRVYSDAQSKVHTTRRRSKGVSEPDAPELPNLQSSSTKLGRRSNRNNDAHRSPQDHSDASDTESTDVDLHSGDYGYGSKVDYEMDDYGDDDIIKMKPTGSKSKPVVAAQLQLPGLSPTVFDGDEVSVQYQDVVAYSDTNAF